MLERIVDDVLEGNERLTITLKSRSGFSRKQVVAKEGAVTTPAPKIRQITFPGSTAQEAWNFS